MPIGFFLLGKDGYERLSEDKEQSIHTAEESLEPNIVSD